MTVEAVINVDVDGPRISRHLYGHFAEHLGRCVYGGFYVGEDSAIPNEGGIRLDVVEALRALRIPNLRWPGGCFADEYHWRDGVGPKKRRPVMVNTHWGGVEENNHFGTHEFMALCDLLGAEPYISGNVGSGTVREMSEWVEYLTRDGDSPMARLRKANGRDEPWRVRFWGLGNEAWGCGGSMTAEHYAQEARRYGTYCRDYGDNQLYKIAAGAAGADYAWTETLMKQLGHLGCQRIRSTGYRALSVHHYTLTGPTWEDKGSATVFDTEEYYTTMLAAAGIEEILAGHAAVMDAYDPGQTVGAGADPDLPRLPDEPGASGRDLVADRRPHRAAVPAGRRRDADDRVDVGQPQGRAAAALAVQLGRGGPGRGADRRTRRRPRVVRGADPDVGGVAGPQHAAVAVGGGATPVRGGVGGRRRAAGGAAGSLVRHRERCVVSEPAR
ncbi:alpha-N-arabinofuranosidase [Paractinoplanes lichenicola]|uniref:alpha-N-arabinofuranosidase n=1 Tax=Paractinoplanes lichenicola TaxID=2802976 RepID=UPI001F332D44|nr:hypothetical protein [Actinoplanes lichenicola]